MNCSRCGTSLAARAGFCSQCGLGIAGARPPAPALTAPLTIEQTNWLRVNAIMPPIFALLTIGGMIGLFSCFFGQFLDRPFAKLFAGLGGLLMLVMLVAMALHVRNNWADLRMGVAQVRVARLVSKRTSSGSRGGYTYYAEFEQVGAVEQGLGWNTADVQTHAANMFFFDHRHFEAKLNGTERRDFAARP